VSTAIVLEDVTVAHLGRAVLRDISLQVGAGELLTILGTSGSGKTTLLRAVAGLVRLQQGKVRIGEALASEGERLLLAPEQRDVAVVFQDLALWPHLTVQGNLAFGLSARGVPREERRERIATVLKRVGLDGKESRHPGELSGGERQRVAIARALVLQPAAILLDEPLASLDFLLRRELLQLFRELLGEQGMTALHVTHDPRDARALGGRVALLEEGRLEHVGTLESLAGRGDLPYARELAGT
jgi:iron(III) transport system ATP-binding protein